MLQGRRRRPGVSSGAGDGARGRMRCLPCWCGRVSQNWGSAIAAVIGAGVSGEKWTASRIGLRRDAQPGRGEGRAGRRRRGGRGDEDERGDRARPAGDEQRAADERKESSAMPASPSRRVHRWR